MRKRSPNEHALTNERLRTAVTTHHSFLRGEVRGRRFLLDHFLDTLGKLLDYWLHTHWLYLLGLILGIVAGFVQLIRMVSSSEADQ